MLLTTLCLLALAGNGELEREAKLKIPQIVSAAGIRAGSRVADVGAGDGFITVRLAHAAGRKGHVWAIDVDRITAIPGLRPGGRLVIVDFMPCRTRDQPRETQAKAHALAPGFVEEELREAGFEIASRDDGFIANPDEEQARWMIVARRPVTAPN